MIRVNYDNFLIMVWPLPVSLRTLLVWAQQKMAMGSVCNPLGLQCRTLPFRFHEHKLYFVFVCNLPCCCMMAMWQVGFFCLFFLFHSNQLLQKYLTFHLWFNIRFVQFTSTGISREWDEMGIWKMGKQEIVWLISRVQEFCVWQWVSGCVSAVRHQQSGQQSP